MTAYRARFLIGLFVLALAGALLDCSRGQPIQYGYKVGHTEGFVIWLTQQTKSETLPNDFKRVILRGRLNLRVRSLAPNGTTGLEFWLENMSGQMQTANDQQELTNIEQLNGQVLLMTLDAHGNVLTLQTPVPPKPEWSGTLQNIRQSLRELWPSLPSRLSRGTSWSRSLTAEDEVQPMGLVRFTTQSSYEARDTHKIGSRQALELDTHYRLSMVMHKRPMTNVNTAVYDITAEGDGSGSLYIDPQDGRLIAAQYETTLNFGSDSAPASMRSQIRQELRSRVELRPIESSTSGSPFAGIGK